MIIKIKRKYIQRTEWVALSLFLIAAIIVALPFTADYADAATNVTNQTVLAIVNITNTEPNITSVVVDDDTALPADEIDLTANNVTVVTCNATVFDYNGWQDIDPNTVNATFHLQSVGADGDTDNNHRYVNSSCGRCIEIDSTTAACDCRIPVQYYANHSNEWMCNMTVQDSGGTGLDGEELNFTDSDASSLVTVTPLLALDTGPLLDYGNLSVTQTSPEIIHNLSNVGNTDLNISVRSFGGENETGVNAINHTMICEFGNISFGNQRYEFGTHKIGTTNFDTMVNVTNQTLNITNSTLFQKVEDTFSGAEQNSSIWRLQIPLTVGGLCNGTIIFQAHETFRN